MRVALIGPLPPPAGGMPAQCADLCRMLAGAGTALEIVRTNASYRPSWIGRIRGVRALFRLGPYVMQLAVASRSADVFHVFANSGPAWYLFAMPAILVAHLKRVPVVVHYHGGGAQRFFANAPRWTRKTLDMADLVIVPSAYLKGIFEGFGVRAEVIPNGIDLERFRCSRRGIVTMAGPHLIITRNLEPVHDIPTALMAFAIVAGRSKLARLTVAGSGPEAQALRDLAVRLGIAEKVEFCGRIDNERIHELYAKADVMLNSSTVDNMPVSILEAFASGVLVVSTDVGGVPHIAAHERSALLVAPRDPQAMAEAVMRLIEDGSLRERLRAAALDQAEHLGWDAVVRLWLDLYRHVVASQTA